MNKTLSLPLRLLLARRVVVRGTSMSPTLEPKERLLFDRLAYKHSPPVRDHIVLADHPLRRDFPLIKRVVAVPGDTVDVKDGLVLVNGGPVPGPLALANPSSEDNHWDLREGYVFLLGDDPERSTDSRQLGPFPIDLVKARAWMVYWPLSRWRVLY